MHVWKLAGQKLFQVLNQYRSKYFQIDWNIYLQFCRISWCYSNAFPFYSYYFNKWNKCLTICIDCETSVTFVSFVLNYLFILKTRHVENFNRWLDFSKFHFICILKMVRFKVLRLLDTNSSLHVVMPLIKNKLLLLCLLVKGSKFSAVI